MSDDQLTPLGLEIKKAKILKQKQKFAQEKSGYSWNAVAKEETQKPLSATIASSIIDTFAIKTNNNLDFHGKNLKNGSFSKENLENANFSGADLSNIDFSGANLRGVDFTGADLTGANLEGADLTGANLSNTKLVNANFKKSRLKNVLLSGADLTDAIFLEIDIDNLTLEDIQELVEFLATYYPHKLNLAKFDLKMLDLSKIDLRNVNLRGVDFTGADLTGVNILELDLSECIITPEQIAQALGRVPSLEELKKILAPKPKKKGKSFFIDMTDFFFDNGIPAGVWDTKRGKGTTFDQIFSAVKRFTNAFKRDEQAIVKPREKDERPQETSSNDELRRAIEENKKHALEEKRKENAQQQSFTPQPKKQIKDISFYQHSQKSRGL